MTLSVAGAVPAARILARDWHLRLSLEQLAAYVRYQFIWLYENEQDWDAPAHNRKRKHWDGGTDSYGVKHTSVWNRIAQMIRKNNADPGMWVHAHFSPFSFLKSGAQLSGMPEMRPTRLCSAQSVGTYNEYCDQLPGILAHDFEIAGMTLAKRFRGTQDLKLSQDDQVFYVVCDELYVSASPFFRHAFSAQLHCARGVERYLWVAALDYDAKQHAYDTALEPWCFTELLKRATTDIRNHWERYR